MTKIYITRYVLSHGIKVRNGRVDPGGETAAWDGQHYMHRLRKPDFHLTAEDAIAYAEDLRVKKLAALRRKITKLEAMRFSVPDEAQP